jgi:PAS domain S-box-containing protein
MGDQKKTKKQLIDELAELRQRIVELEKSESDLKRAEKALKKSENQYRRLVETSPAIVWSFSDKRGTLFVSSRVKSILGYSPDFFYENPWLWNESIHPDDQYPVAQAIKDFASGKDLKVEYRIKDSSGNWRWFHDRSVGRYTEGAEMIIEGISIDITERKQAEEALRESKEQFRAIFDRSAMGIGLTDLDGRILSANPALLQMLRYGEGELTGKSVLELTHPEDVEKERKLFRQLKEEEGDSIRLEKRYIRKDGSMLWANLIASICHDNTGTPRFVIGMVEDITERKRAEEEIRQEKGFSERLINSTVDGIIAFDRDCRFIVWNPGMESIFGIGKGEILGHPAFDLFPFLKGAGEDRFFFEALAGKTVVSKNRPYVVPETGHHGFFDGYYSPLLNESGEIIGGLAIIHDITERKRAEEALRESEEKYRLVVENAAEAIFVAQEGMLTFGNPKATEVFGYSIEELVSRPFEEFIHPEDRERLMNCHLSRSQGEDLPSVYPFRIINKSGKVRWVELNTVLITWEEKPATLNFMSDVTERMRVEEALKESELRYRTLVEHSNDLISEVGSDGHLLYLSPNHKTIIGYEPAERLGRNIFENVHPDDLPVISNAVETGKQSGYSKVTYRYRHKDGQWMWLESSGRTYLSKEGEQRAVVVSRDITERKRTEDALRQAEGKYRNLFENAIEGIFQTTPEGAFISANPALARIHGYDSPEELIHTVTDIGAQLYVDSSLRSELTRLLTEREVVRGFEAQVYSKDGSRIWISLNIKAVHDTDGRLLLYEGTIQDITERKRTEEKVRLYEEQLRSLISELSLVEEKERRRIATDLHDHIGQILALAKIKLESLRETASSTGLAMPLDTIREMIEQAIHYTRTLTFELSPPVLYELGFEAAVEWLTEQIQEQHGILVDFEDDLQPKPLNNELRILLFKAVRELVINIVKHAQAQRAKVSIRRDGKHIHVLIRDDGYGFDPFKDDPSGKMNGFGLFSIRERLKHFGGSFEIESNPGHGTRVTLVAPLNG